jgi:hypothetical protein
MDRLSFLSGLVALAGSGVVGALAISPSRAISVPQPEEALSPTPSQSSAETAPDGTPVEQAYWYGHRRRVYRRSYRHYRRWDRRHHRWARRHYHWNHGHQYYRYY